MYLKRKYQVGGVVYTPYLPAQAGTAQGTTSTSASSSTSSTPEKISGTMKKEVIDILKENGIPSDVDQFLQYANNFLDKSKNLSNYSLFGGNDDDYDMSDLIKVQSLANKVKFNKALYDKANENLTKQYAWSEVALTDKGQMYVYDTEKGEVTKIDPSTYHENSDKYQALTNSDVLSYREQSQPFDNSSLNDLQNAVGMKSITDYLREIIKAFGKDSIEGYATKDKDAILSGFHFLMENGPDGFYKVKSEEQLRDVNRALTYLYNSLPENMKQLLRAKTAAEGGDPNGKDRFELLVQALSEHTSRDYSATFDKPATEYDPLQSGKKGGSSGGSEQLAQNTYQIRFGEGKGIPTSVLLTPTAAKIFDTATMKVEGTDFGPMEDWNGKQLGQMNLTKLLKEWALGTSVRNADITFGNKLLDYSDLPAIMYDGQSLTTMVYLPYKDENGHFVSDFELFERFNAFNNAAKNVTPVERNELAAKYGLDSNDMVYNPKTGGYTLKNTMRFVTFSAYAGDDTINLDNDNKLYLEKVSKAKGSTLKDPYNNALKYNDIYADKKKALIVNKGFGKATSNDFWRGNVYIAAPSAFYGYNSSSNEFETKDTFNDIARKVQANQMIVDAVEYARNTDPDYLERTQIGQWKYE